MAPLDRAFATLGMDMPGPVTPWERAWDGFRHGNSILDALSYNVDKLSHEEGEHLGPLLAGEGVILRVGPSAKPSLEVHDIGTALPPDEDLPVVIAGVGSSALGAAALARDVADAFDRPALAVVSGRGLVDLTFELMGGALFFGQANAWRQVIQDHAPGGAAATDIAPTLTPTILRWSQDVMTLTRLLASPRTIPLLIGHSKGNLVISEALHGLSQADKDRRGKTTKIVTLSARVTMPKECAFVLDIIGAADVFGELNSRIGIRSDVVAPGAGHTTNITAYPNWALDVTKVLSEHRSKLLS